VTFPSRLFHKIFSPRTFYVNSSIDILRVNNTFCCSKYHENIHSLIFNALTKGGNDISSLVHVILCFVVQGGSNITGTDLCVRLYKSVPVIFVPPCINTVQTTNSVVFYWLRRPVTELILYQITINLQSVCNIHKSAYSTICLRISCYRHQIMKKSLTSDPQIYMLPHFQEAFARDGFQLSLQSGFDLLITQIHEANWIIHQISVKEKEGAGRQTLPEFVHINRPFSDKLRLLWQIDLVIKSLILERPQFFYADFALSCYL